MATIRKTLSRNDVSETDAHQAGMYVLKDSISFFPRLGTGTLNPRVTLVFEDESGRSWTFDFIYYNNAYFGGTRDEYRLTPMNDYFNLYNIKAGDTIILERATDGKLKIRHEKV
ncbi:EcoRII N-terminal effector-binding domain-containing protein [Paenibacillus sp. tmac-D7]|uniref:EcoRII N-terminal effector-binding domain-containing protein n=1 Tax=Paenibacillus sp. tmac-D7 TaxID=2591462 RepID=UPI001141EDBB|nr:EcoRII N-terminal effector-binding domain-containing protein [Paenibacillus sp. tmac-D7]